jgi:UDP-2,3-diacylglucosamine pyrophosphatase LpxH
MNTYRSIFLSDLHLGAIGCKTTQLIQFLQQNTAESIYLIGDIVDMWARRSLAPEYADVLRGLLSKTRVFYTPGNHDGRTKDLLGLSFGEINVSKQFTHETADGSRYLVLHGDEHDFLLLNHAWLPRLGTLIYEEMNRLNRALNMLLRFARIRSVNVCAVFKTLAKRTIGRRVKFERTMAGAALSSHCQGVICGHTHHPVMKMIDGVFYVNTGDWVENCSAVVEHFDGHLEMIKACR